MEHDGRHLGVHRHLADPQHHDGVVGRPGSAARSRLFQPEAGALDEDAPRGARRRPSPAREPVAGLGGQRARGLVMFLAEHTDAQHRQSLSLGHVVEVFCTQNDTNGGSAIQAQRCWPPGLPGFRSPRLRSPRHRMGNDRRPPEATTLSTCIRVHRTIRP